MSSSFESDLGLAYVASIAHRLELLSPVGIGTYHYLNDYICENGLHFVNASVTIPKELHPDLKMMQSLV